MTTAGVKPEPENVDELRSSVRFPLRLPIELTTDSEEVVRAQTQNISSGGVLFDVDQNLAVGSKVEFSIAMPGMILGTPSDVIVKCIGRVVRSHNAEGRAQVAAVIDEYRFQRTSR